MRVASELEGAPAISAPAFVGRRAELAAVAGALSGSGALVFIEGDAGIGKTRLVREVLARLPGPHRSLVAGCLPFPDPFTLGPVVDAIRQATSRVDTLRLSALAGVLRPLFPEWAPDLPPAPEPAEDATAARHRLFRALSELLERLGVGVFTVEDAHWADQATLELLLFLCARRPFPLSVVVTCRRGDLPADSLLLRLGSTASESLHQVRIGLGPLALDETAALMSSMLDGEQVSEPFAQFLQERTDGVPLAVEESVRLMRDRAELTRRGGDWMRRRLDGIRVPASIRDSVLERVHRLGPDAQVVLQAAAVLSDPSQEETLVAVSELPADRARAALAQAIATSLLQENERRLLSFRHVLAGRAVYEAIPAPQRRELHRRAGRLLEALTPQPYPQLARHMREAGEAADWCRYAERAVDVALESGDEATANTLLHRLLTTPDLSPDTVARLAGRLPLTSFTGTHRHEAVIAALRSILDTGDVAPDTEAHIRYQLARVLLSIDENAAARAELERAIPGLAHDPPTAVRAMAMLALRGDAGLSRAARLAWLNRAAAIRLPAMSAHDRLRFTVDRISAMLHLGLGEGWALADELPDTAAFADERRQLTRAHLNIGNAAMVWGHHGAAQRWMARGLDFSTRYGQVRQHAEILVTQAHLDWFIGRWDGLAERAEALEANADIAPNSRQEIQVVRGRLHAAKGQWSPAEQCLASAIEDARRRGVAESPIEPAAALARLRLRVGRADEAVSITEEPMRVLVNHDMWLYASDLAPVRVAALLAADRPAEAESLLGAFAAGLADLSAPAAQAALVQCQAVFVERCGDQTAAADLFAAAADAWQALPQPYSALLAHERRAACLIEAGRCDDGRDVLKQVYAELSVLGATGDIPRVAQALRRLGVAVPRTWRGGRRGYGDRLSPRELEVVRLVATGRTNREIADALNRSVPTVATQLQSAMRKLGASSRTALAASAIETGLVGVDAEPH